MSTDLEQQLASLIESARQTGSDISVFIAEQAPDLFAQIIAWHFWSGVMQAALAAAIMGAVALGARLTWALAERLDRDDRHLVRGVSIMVAGLIFAITAPTFFASGVADAVKAKVAPKVVLVEKVGEVLNGRR